VRQIENYGIIYWNTQQHYSGEMLDAKKQKKLLNWRKLETYSPNHCILPKLLEFTGQNSSKCTLVKHGPIYYKFYTYTQIHINSGEIPDAQTSKNSIREKLEAYSPNHCTSPKPLG